MGDLAWGLAGGTAHAGAAPSAEAMDAANKPGWREELADAAEAMGQGEDSVDREVMENVGWFAMGMLKGAGLIPTYNYRVERHTERLGNDLKGYEKTGFELTNSFCNLLASAWNFVASLGKPKGPSLQPVGPGGGGAAISPPLVTTGANNVVSQVDDSVKGFLEKLDRLFASDGPGDVGPQRGVGGKGWRGDKTWKGNVNEFGRGGTIEEVNGGIPTQQEAVDLIIESKGKVVRVEGPHPEGGISPHTYPHINYETANGAKGTIQIQEVVK